MEKEIGIDTWVYVHNQFRGKVVRIRKLCGIKWYDVEVGGVVLPYERHEIAPGG